MTSNALNKLVTVHGPITIEVNALSGEFYASSSKAYSGFAESAFAALDKLAAAIDAKTAQPEPTPSDRLNNMPATIQMADLTYRLVQPFVLHPDGRSEGPYYRREGDASLRLYIPEAAYLAGLIDTPTAMYHVE